VEGGEPLQSFENFADSGDEYELISEPNSHNENDSVLEDTPSRPIGDLYALHAALMLQAAQPYLGDHSTYNPDEPFDDQRFLIYLISDSEYIVMDSEHDEGITLKVELMHNEGFLPALWYAQARSELLGLDMDEAYSEGHYLEEMGDVQAEATHFLLGQYYWQEGEDPAPSDKFEVDVEGESS
jgi:hypothetical protein